MLPIEFEIWSLQNELAADRYRRNGEIFGLDCAAAETPELPSLRFTPFRGIWNVLVRIVSGGARSAVREFIEF